MKYFFIICLILLATACNSTLTATKPQPTTLTPPYLVKVKSSGGLCQYGLCEAEYILSTSGDLTKIYPQDLSEDRFKKITKSVKINSTDFALLKTQIINTDFKKILDSKFTEICPTAYDGTQNLFSIYQNNQEIILDSCQQIINPANEPFKLIYQLIFK